MAENQKKKHLLFWLVLWIRSWVWLCGTVRVCDGSRRKSKLTRLETAVDTQHRHGSRERLFWLRFLDIDVVRKRKVLADLCIIPSVTLVRLVLCCQMQIIHMNLQEALDRLIRQETRSDTRCHFQQIRQ